MSTESPKRKFSISIPLALTIVLLSFFILFRGPLSNLISGGDCLEMEFFESKINTCNEKKAQQTLVSDQQEISGFVKSLKNKIDSLESINNALQAEVVTLESKLAGDNTAADISLSEGMVLSDNENKLYERYSKVKAD